MMAANKKNHPRGSAAMCQSGECGQKVPRFGGMCTSKPSVGVRTCARKGGTHLCEDACVKIYDRCMSATVGQTGDNF